MERPESHTIHFNEIPKDADAVDVGSKQVTIVKHLDDDDEVFLLKISGCFFMQKKISTEYKLWAKLHGKVVFFCPLIVLFFFWGGGN